MTKVNSCQICNNNNLEQLAKANSNIKNFNIVRCTFCGLAFQNPIPTKKDLIEFYENVYDGKSNLKSTEEAFLNYDEKQEEKRLCEIEKFKKGGNILDVGASSGFFLKKVKEKINWVGYGIEYSMSGAKNARKDGLNIRIGEITNVEFPDNYFDVITMHSVLEHIPNLLTTIEAIHKKLKKGGLFVFNVPNISSFEFFVYGLLKKSFAGFIYEHLYYFTPKSVDLLLTKNGFRVLLMTSRHHSALRLPPPRPLIGWLTFPSKLILEYTSLGGLLKKGNIIYVYAEKVN